LKKAFKSSLCILLSLLLIIPVTLSVTAKEQAPLSVWVASDIHFEPLSDLGPIGEQNTLPGDPLYHHVNSKGMLLYEDEAIVNEFLSRFEKSPVKYLLIPGDLTEDGYWSEHLAIAKILRDFQSRTGKQIFLIPGNHDIRTSDSNNRLNLSDFLKIYADIGYNKALARHAGSASYTADLDNGYRLIAIDACIYREDGSYISPDLHAWIEAQVKQAKIDGKKLIGMVHHSLLEHFGIESIAGNLLCLDNYRGNATQFADWGIKYFFTGHEHANDISSAVSANGNRIYDIETDSLITYPNAYREVTFTDNAVNVETKYIDNIDLSYLPAGFNQAQLNLIQNDFHAYSLGYFKASIESVAYDMPNSTKRIAGSLKINEGTAAYEALSNVMNIMGEALKLPLYDKTGTPAINSVEEIAAKAGIKIDKSDYTNVLDIAGDIYAQHYAGDEKLTYGSPEVTLFRQSFNAVLVYALTNIPVSMANTLFESMGLPDTGLNIKDNIYTQTAKLIYMKTAAKLVFIEFVKPLMESIITDSYAPGDLNETLEPYGVTNFIEGRTSFISDPVYVLNIIARVIGIVLNSVKAIAIN